MEIIFNGKFICKNPDFADKVLDLAKDYGAEFIGQTLVYSDSDYDFNLH